MDARFHSPMFAVMTDIVICAMCELSAPNRRICNKIMTKEYGDNVRVFAQHANYSRERTRVRFGFMQKFHTRVYFVEAVRWLGKIDVLNGIPVGVVAEREDGRTFITTPDGDCELKIGDWIVKDSSGAYVPMGDNIFHQKYEPAQMAIAGNSLAAVI